MNESILQSTPMRGHILIKLPNYQKERERVTGGGIYIPHLEGHFEHDVSHGTVVKCGQGVFDCLPGDEVFFPNICIQCALQNMGRDKTRPDANNIEGSMVPAFYLGDEGEHYLIMPEERIFVSATDRLHNTVDMDIHPGVICIVREGKVICLNGYHIMKDAYDKGEVVDGVRTKKVGLIEVVVLAEEQEKNKRYEVLYAPTASPVQVGDIILTEPHCDLKLEGDFNYPLLPKGSYYVQENNILGVLSEA